MQKAVEFVTKNILENLPDEWNMILFPGEQNKDQIGEFVKTLPQAKQSRVIVKDLGLKTMDTAAYNALMMSDKILNEIPTEIFMVVQTDSLICKGGNHLLKNFMKYDYVGAPWKDRNALGNGGFSLRRKSKMLEILKACPKEQHNEDGFYSGGCDGARPHKPSPKEAEEFSVETIFNGKQPFGIHKAWHYMPKKSKVLEEKCLGYSELQELNTHAGGSKPMKAAVMAIFKNESMVMREWIEHYKWQGMDCIVLLNNDSTDNWKDITDSYKDFVTVIDTPGRHIQLKSYNEKGLPFLREQGVDVVAVLDLDEYLFAKDGKKLKDHIQEIFSKPDRPSGFICGWSMFGSNGHDTHPESIRKGFTKRVKDHAEPENGSSAKSVIFLADVNNLNSQHIPELPGRRDTCPPGIQLNHYQIMSKEYFKAVKMRRGNVFTSAHNTVRNMDYFQRCDQNNVEDLSLANLVIESENKS